MKNSVCHEPHKPTCSLSCASSSLHKLGLEPDLSQARSFCDIYFPNLPSQIRQSVRREEQEETGGDGKRLEKAGDGYYNKKNRSGYSEVEKSVRVDGSGHWINKNMPVDMQEEYRMSLVISFVRKLKGLTEMNCGLAFLLSLCRKVELCIERNRLV